MCLLEDVFIGWAQKQILYHDLSHKNMLTQLKHSKNCSPNDTDTSYHHIVLQKHPPLPPNWPSLFEVLKISSNTTDRYLQLKSLFTLKFHLDTLLGVFYTSVLFIKAACANVSWNARNMKWA